MVEPTDTSVALCSVDSEVNRSVNQGARDLTDDNRQRDKGKRRPKRERNALPERQNLLDEAGQPQPPGDGATLPDEEQEDGRGLIGRCFCN